MKNLSAAFYFCVILLHIQFVVCISKQQIRDDGDDDQDCKIVDAGDVEEHLINIIDTDPAGLVVTYQGSNIKSINKIFFPDDQMSRYFEFTYLSETEEIEFELTNRFTTDYERTENLTQVLVLVEFECESNNNKNLSFVINITDTNNFDPQFIPNPPFSYTILLPAGEGTPVTPLYGEIGGRDFDLTTYGIDFGIEENPYFNISTYRQSNHKKVIYYATLVAMKPIMEMNGHLELNISATDMDLTGEPRRTVYARVTIIPNPSLIFPQVPKFTKAFHKGVLRHKVVELDNIPFPVNDHSHESIELSLSGDMSTYFKLEINEGDVSIKLDDTTPDSVIIESNYFIFSLDTTNEYNMVGNTVIFLENLKELLGSTSINPVYFSSYHFDNYTLYPNVLFEISCDLDFNLHDYNEYFKIECIDDNVHLTTLNQLPKELTSENDFITLQISVENDFQKIYTTIVVNLIISELQIDPFLIIDVDEEQEYTSLLELPYEDCKYDEIISIWPEEAINWFRLNNGILSTQKIDREHPAIAFMNISQIQLELSIVCNYLLKKRNYLFNNNIDITQLEISGNVSENDRQWIYTKNADFSQNIQLINVIVNDINDNPPIFETDDLLNLRYPVYSLAQQIRPQNLAIAKANDADIGINAKIKYSTDNDRFSIHPYTGVIYPVGNIFSSNTNDERIRFIISATDENGEGIHNTDFNILVQPLKEEQTAIITINNAMVEDSLDILDKISNSTSCTFVLLSSAVLPSADISYFSARNEEVSSSNTSLVMFVYALDKNNEILKGSDIASLINEDSEIETVTATSLTATKMSLELCEKEGLIAAVSVLGVTLIIAFIGLVIVFILYKRYYGTKYEEYHNNNSSNSSQINIPRIPRAEAKNTNGIRNSNNDLMFFD